jgi:predicted flap endonuclease-1-like 5' DNA nuclease
VPRPAFAGRKGNIVEEESTMGKWLRRLLLWGLLVLIALFVASRLLNREEDFDDYDDIDMGLDFNETPVEIDVSAESASPNSFVSTGVGASMESAAEDTGASGGATMEHSLIDIVGIGPTYAARLQDAGISSLSDLANADAGSLAEKVEVIGGRATIEDWIKQAQEMSSSGTSGSR